jgi:voltage-gated potassium channel Kch
VNDVVAFHDLSKAEAYVYSERLARNPHVKAGNTRDVVFIIGDETYSTLLNRAILLATASANHRRVRAAVYAFSDEMVELIGVSGTINNNAGPICVADADHIKNLKRILGIREGG